jgi:transcriptional regulator with XRE-family HTH domain
MESLNMEQFGKRVREARKAAKMNQEALAHLAGLNRPNLAKLERASKPHVRADTVYRLALALHVSADYLLGLRPPAPVGEDA